MGLYLGENENLKRLTCLVQVLAFLAPDKVIFMRFTYSYFGVK